VSSVCAALFAVLNKTPGWKDTNVQACGLVYQIATEVCVYVCVYVYVCMY